MSAKAYAEQRKAEPTGLISPSDMQAPAQRNNSAELLRSRSRPALAPASALGGLGPVAWPAGRTRCDRDFVPSPGHPGHRLRRCASAVATPAGTRSETSPPKVAISLTPVEERKL